MIQIPGYTVVEEIYNDHTKTICRAVRNGSNASVVAKVLRKAIPMPREIASLRHEFEILGNLKADGVPNPIEFIDSEGVYALIMDDFKGISLKNFIYHKHVGILQFLEISMGITKALQQIHAGQIIHKDINPANILIDPNTLQICIIDFGISTGKRSEINRLISSEDMEGTLLYMSPEQTGRMNRSLDTRADMYSLGVTLFELATQRLPFLATDPLELVHAHMAEKPESPSHIRPVIPEMVSEIILKLLAKQAEDRYQGAAGLLVDLEFCLREYAHNGIIPAFSLGVHDFSGELNLQQKLYGRTEELLKLESAFQQMMNGSSTTVLVKGTAGIGKTAFVHELKKHVTGSKGYFVEGKFDQYSRNIPYSAMLQAFDDIVGKLLKESDQKLQIINETLHERLGPNLGLIVELIPSTRHIVGSIPPPPALTAKEAENRFRMAIRLFISSLVNTETPLVIFLDDLQWADQASLNLMKWLLENGTSGFIMFVGAYRDQQLDERSPFVSWLHEVAEHARGFHSITLEPLKEEHVTEMLADGLRQTASQVQPLSHIVFEKTRGNPFFISEFVRTLCEKNLLVYDITRLPACWTWNQDGIQQITITDNVVDLILARASKLSPVCVRVLKNAAAINRTFDIETIGLLISDISREEIAHNLDLAIREEFIFPVSENYKYIGQSSAVLNATYSFVHDRIQQALYSLTADEERSVMHLQLGWILAGRMNEGIEVELMEVVGHLNQALPMITVPEQRMALAGMNVGAGKKAKESNAYAHAIELFRTAIDLLPPDAWKTCNELAFGANILLAESEFLHGNFPESENIYNHILEEATDLHQQAAAICLKMILYIYSGRYGDAIDMAHKGLALFGFDLPNPELPDSIPNAMGKTLGLLGNRDVQSIVDSEAMSDPNMIMVNNILAILLPAAFLSKQSNLWTIGVLEMTSLLLEKGITQPGALGLASFGMMVGQILGDTQKAHDIGETAIAITEKLDDPTRDSQLKFVSGAFLSSWVKDPEFCIDRLDESTSSGLQYGDLIYAGYSLQVKTGFYFYNFYPLRDFVSALDQAIPLAQSLGARDVLSSLHGSRDVVVYEMDPSISELRIEEVTEEEWVGKMFAEGFIFPVGVYDSIRGAMHLINGDDASVLACVGRFQLYKDAFFSNLVSVYMRFLEVTALTRSGLKSGNITEENAKRIAELCAQTNAQNASNNRIFNNICTWMNAMEKWALNGSDACLDAMEKVIEVARDSRNYMMLGLANEIVGELYLTSGKISLSKAYLTDSHLAYEKYGVFRKTEAMRKQHPQLLYDLRGDAPAEWKSTLSNTQKFAARLDYLTVIKASQLLSGEMDPEVLRREFLTICNENAGAQRGLFLLRDNMQWHVATQMGEWHAGSDPEFTFPHSVIKYVERTGELLALPKAVEDEKFGNDPYFIHEKSQSVLCAPIRHKGRLKGILYLENNLSNHIFGKDVQEMILLLASQIGISVENAELYGKLEESNKDLESKVRERTRELSNLYAENERLLLNMLPSSIAQRLKAGETYIADYYDEISVIFTDIVNFTPLASSMDTADLIMLLNALFREFDKIMRKHGCEPIKTLGDGYMAVSGAPITNPDHAKAMANATLELMDLIADEAFWKDKIPSGVKIVLRAGLHCGPAVGGVIGSGKYHFDFYGDTINTAARMESHGEAGTIHCSPDFMEKLQNEYHFKPRGMMEIKGKGQMSTYTLLGPLAAAAGS
ncbi:MAG: AAA family ATPase [Bacteroidetes bacterium]|nr:AAA family ATPase [Bacteroidota bacterium]